MSGVDLRDPVSYPKGKASDADQPAAPDEDFNDPLPPELMP